MLIPEAPKDKHMMNGLSFDELKRCDSRSRFCILTQRTQQILAQQAWVATSTLSRMVGLLSHDHLDSGEALIIPSCQSIHTAFMRFAIDVVFVDRDGHVVGLKANLPPWRLTPLIWRAWGVVEMPAGTLASVHLVVGDRLVVKPTRGA